MEQIATKKAKEHDDSLDLVENTMDHLLLLIAYFLSLCSFSWLAGNVVKWKYKNSPGLDLCSWLYHYISTEWSHSFSSDVWLAGSHRLGATSCDRTLTTTSIKCRWFHRIVRSTAAVDTRHKSFHPRLADSSTNIFDLGSTEASTATIFSKASMCRVNGISTQTHFYVMVTWNDWDYACSIISKIKIGSYDCFISVRFIQNTNELFLWLG